MKKKILFIQPTIYDDYGKLVKKKKLYFIGLAYPLLAAMLPADWEAEICLETIEEIPFDTDAPLIGLGGMGHASARSIEIAAEFKKRGKTVVMGGPMASLASDIAMKHFDSVMIGDAEEAFSQMISDFENGCLQPSYRKKLNSLSTPLPRYDLIMKKNIGDFLPVQAGRGCPNSCSFCSIFCMYRTQYLKRDIGEVIRDIKYVKKLGFKKFLLIDDNILSDPEYMIALCKEIKKLDMRWMSQCSIEIANNAELLQLAAESGCYTLSFGLESLSEQSLKLINKEWAKPKEYLKNIKTCVNAGIDIASEMIVGIDTDTRESLLKTVDFIKESGIIAPKFYVMTPIPGTDYYDEMLSEGRIVEEDVFKFTPSTAVITHPHMKTEEITATYWEIYRRLYTVPAILKRTVFRKRFFKNPGRSLFYLMVNLVYRGQIKRKVPPNIL